MIDRVFAFDDAVDAYRYYEAAQPLGTVVITIPDHPQTHDQQEHAWQPATAAHDGPAI